MRQIGIFRYEQRLSQRATEALKQMTELQQLRELVRLAEAAKTLSRSNGLTRSLINPKIVDRFAGSSPARVAGPLATS